MSGSIDDFLLRKVKDMVRDEMRPLREAANTLEELQNQVRTHEAKLRQQSTEAEQHMKDTREDLASQIVSLGDSLSRQTEAVERHRREIGELRSALNDTLKELEELRTGRKEAAVQHQVTTEEAHSHSEAARATSSAADVGDDAMSQDNERTEDQPDPFSPPLKAPQLSSTQPQKTITLGTLCDAQTSQTSRRPAAALLVGQKPSTDTRGMLPPPRPDRKKRRVDASPDVFADGVRDSKTPLYEQPELVARTSRKAAPKRGALSVSASSFSRQSKAASSRTVAQGYHNSQPGHIDENNEDTDGSNIIVVPRKSKNSASSAVTEYPAASFASFSREPSSETMRGDDEKDGEVPYADKDPKTLSADSDYSKLARQALDLASPLWNMRFPAYADSPNKADLEPLKKKFNMRAHPVRKMDLSRKRRLETKTHADADNVGRREAETITGAEPGEESGAQIEAETQRQKKKVRFVEDMIKTGGGDAGELWTASANQQAQAKEGQSQSIPERLVPAADEDSGANEDNQFEQAGGKRSVRKRKPTERAARAGYIDNWGDV